MKYLADANLLSEVTKPLPDARVVQWMRDHKSEFAVTPIILGELEYGILLLPAGQKRRRLETWFAEGVLKLHILDFDAATGSAWAQLLARLKRRGLAMPVKDNLIAASALRHHLIVATRNAHDFRNAGVVVVNPFA